MFQGRSHSFDDDIRWKVPIGRTNKDERRVLDDEDRERAYT